MASLDGWVRFEHPGFHIGFSYPAITPEGWPVDRREDEGEHFTRIHLTSPGSGELYVEVMKLPDLTPEEEYARHRPYLEERLGAGAVTALDGRRFSRGRHGPTAFDGTGESGPCFCLASARIHIASSTTRVLR